MRSRGLQGSSLNSVCQAIVLVLLLVVVLVFVR